MVDLELVYSIVYRNFSRNIHSTDFMENHMNNYGLEMKMEQEYRERRDNISGEVAYTSAINISETINRIFSLGYKIDIEE